MWIMTSDGKRLVDVKHFAVEKNIGGKDKKYTITGYLRDDGSLASAAVCAFYPSEESAYKELMKLKEAIEENSGKVYQFAE